MLFALHFVNEKSAPSPAPCVKYCSPFVIFLLNNLTHFGKTFFCQLVADTNQAILWVRDHLPVLQSKDFGKDESTTSTLLRKNIAMQNDIKAFHKTIQELEGRVNIMIQGQYCGDSQRNATADLQVGKCC